MGAADVVPGVSGGTIAFITGIYEELIHSIKSIDLDAVKLFFTGKWISFWKKINGNFLLSVFAGIFIAIISLARLLEHLLETHPVLIWSFFFGLILVSSYVVARRIKQWDYTKVVALVGGIAIAFYITSITPAATTNAAWFIILSGMLASCAMILPGISGSFILLLLGKYAFALRAVNEADLGAIVLLGIGAVIGLLSLSRLLSWLFNKYHDGTVAILAGFMIGSLNKIWPWKKTVETVVIEGVEKTARAEKYSSRLWTTRRSARGSDRHDAAWDWTYPAVRAGVQEKRGSADFWFFAERLLIWARIQSILIQP